MRFYTAKADCRNAAVLYQETETEVMQKNSMHERSDFILLCLGSVAVPG